jgi:ketosteroid isomerase-like protein
MKKLILPLFLGTLLFSSCGSKTETKSAFNLDSAKNEIEAWNVNFETVVKNKDSVGFSNLYAENAVRMAPNTAEIQGRANILKSVVEPFKVIGSTNLTMIDAWGDENTITTTGTYEHFLPDGKSVEKGKYMGVLKRVDGKLVSSRDIWNSNDAVPAIGK